MTALTFTNRPGVRVTVDVDGDTTRIYNTYSIPRKLLDANAELRKENRRAPLGDSHGAWQKCADNVPLALLMEKIPPEHWEDEKALARFVNDPDLRAFRTDGDHRVF
jgi:hypothetical protein